MRDTRPASRTRRARFLPLPLGRHEAAAAAAAATAFEREQATAAGEPNERLLPVEAQPLLDARGAQVPHSSKLRTRRNKTSQQPQDLTQGDDNSARPTLSSSITTGNPAANTSDSSRKWRTRWRRRRRRLRLGLRLGRGLLQSTVAVRSSNLLAGSPSAAASAAPVALMIRRCALLLAFATMAAYGQQLAAEPRASDLGGQSANLPSALKPPLGSANNPNNIALSQLVNFLNSINNQQQQQQQQQNVNARRSPQPQPLPLGQMGPMGGNQRPIPLGPSSTPVNPFVAAVNFQPTRRQPQPQPQQLGFTPQPQPQPQAPSSSPPTLTLNRIANQYANQQPGGPLSPRFTNSQQLRPTPVNAIPLSGGGGQGASGNRNQQALVQGQRRPPQMSGGSFQQQQPGRSPLMPPPQVAQPTAASPGPRPLLTGFAPSGPPPSAAGSTAISVVQSPANAIGQPASPFEMPLGGGGANGQFQSQTRPPPSSTPAEPKNTSVQQAAGSEMASADSRDQQQASSSTSTTISTPSATQPTTTTAAAATTTGSAPPSTSTSSTGASVQPPRTTTTSSATSGQGTSTLTMIASSEPPETGSSGGGEPQVTTTTTTTTGGQLGSSSSSSSSSPSDNQQQPTAAPGEPGASSSWSPVQQAHNRTRQAGGGGSSLAPSPDIVTVPPGYNPDAPPPSPQSYDIAVSAQMGGARAGASGGGGHTGATLASDTQAAPPTSVSAEVSPSTAVPTPALTSSVVVAAAPTETTTIIWSSESSTATRPPLIQATRTQQQQVHAQAVQATQAPGQPPARIRDSSMMQHADDAQQAAAATAAGDQATAGVVYGKAPSREVKPPSGRPFVQTAPLDSQVRPFPAGSQPVRSNHGGSSSSSAAAAAGTHGAPFKPSRQLNGSGQSGGGGAGGLSVGSGFSIAAAGNQTMPTGDIQDYVAGAPPPIVSMSGTPAEGAADGAPTISAQGGPDPATFDLAPEASAAAASVSTRPQHQQQQQAGSSSSSGGGGGGSNEGADPSPALGSTPASAPRLRRPTFKPKPAVPPIRIDSCIVGDDSSCDQAHNERCVTEYGISSCHCKPGFARLSQLRGYCSPISLLQFNLKIDKLSDDRKLAFNASLENPNSEEYQYLEFETVQALAGAMQQTSLARQFMGARVNKFYERKGKVWANVSVNLELSNLTRNEIKIQQVAHAELLKLTQVARAGQRQPLGESTLVLDGSRDSISKLTDVNECASRELNDCSKHATCTNEFGGYSCQCLPGYEDKLAAAPAPAPATGISNHEINGTASQQQQQQVAELRQARQGRVCMGCSPAYCSNRGECFIQEGRKQCKCRANFMGSRCDIDSEVLAVAVGGSLAGLVILIITFWCLFVYNRRWRREQQKMDAASATSGLTYNYVNSGASATTTGGSGVGLMSPGGGGGGSLLGGHHMRQPGAAAAGLLGSVVSGRSAAAAYTMGHRMGASGGGGGARNHGYHADQQAIIGRTSSGSSAASQPIACNPYAPGAYEDGLLIAPASTGSSEQTSPSANSYRGIMGAHHAALGSNHSAAMLATAGNAYTLSGHHHHHNHQLQQQQQQQHYLMQQQQQQQRQLAAAAAHHMQHHNHHQHHHHHHQQQQHNSSAGKQLTQFHPSALLDAYGSQTLSAQNNYCAQPMAAHLAAAAATANGYDPRWRTLQQADNIAKQSSLAGYYLVR